MSQNSSTFYPGYNSVWEDYDSEFDLSEKFSESPRRINRTGKTTNWIFWIILIVIILVFIGVFLFIWLKKSNKTTIDPSTKDQTSIINPENNPNPTSDHPTKPESSGGTGIFVPVDPANPFVPTKPIDEPSEIKVTVSGFVINTPKTKSWFHGKTLDLAPPSKGYLIATISGKRYVLTFKRIKDGVDKLVLGMCLTDYGEPEGEDYSSITFRGSPLIWNYRTLDHQTLQSYLLAQFNRMDGPPDLGNLLVNREGLPIYLDDVVDHTEYTPLFLMAEMDDSKRLLGYYLVNMNGDPLCFTQEDKHSDSSRLQIGMINPAVYTEQYSKLLIRFELHNISTRQIDYQNTYISRIDRRNPIKINGLFASRWLINASIRPYKLPGDPGTIIMIHLNNFNYTLSIDPTESPLEKIVKYLYLKKLTGPDPFLRLYEDPVRLKISLLVDLEQTEIFQSQTGILHLDTEQLNPQENTLQIFEDISTTVLNRYMMVGKAQSPLLLLNGTGFEDQNLKLRGVAIGVRLWNPDFYPKQRRLILRLKM